MAKTVSKAKKNSAFMKPMQPSEHLAKIVGAEPLPRSEVTKKIWAHIKKHKLQNPQNKREILADDKLQPVFGAKKMDMFQMAKAVNKTPEIIATVTTSTSPVVVAREECVSRGRKFPSCRLCPNGSTPP